MNSTTEKTVLCNYAQTIFFADDYRNVILASLTINSQLFPVPEKSDLTTLPELVAELSPVIAFFGLRPDAPTLEKFDKMGFQRIIIADVITDVNNNVTNVPEHGKVFHVPYETLAEHVQFTRGHTANMILEYMLCEDPDYVTVINRHDAEHFKIGICATDEPIHALIQKMVTTYRGIELMESMIVRGALIKNIREQVESSRIKYHLIRYDLGELRVAAVYCSEFIEDMRSSIMKEYANLRILYRLSEGESGLGYEMNIIGNANDDVAKMLNIPVVNQKSPCSIITWLPLAQALKILTFLTPEAKL